MKKCSKDEEPHILIDNISYVFTSLKDYRDTVKKIGRYKGVKVLIPPYAAQVYFSPPDTRGA